MKIAVCIKEVLDARLPLQVLSDSGKIEHLGTEAITLINPADRAALEIAIRLRSDNPGSKVHAFNVSAKGREAALHFALARGADAVELIESRAEHNAPPLTALQLAARFSDDSFDLIFCGDETLDNSSGMVGPLIAELIGIPQVTSVCKLRQDNRGVFFLERALDRGNRELVEVAPPALITFTADATEPQYVSLRRLNSARKKEIPVWCSDPALFLGKSLSWPISEKVTPSRARVRKKFAPDANLSPAERVRMIMNGGTKAGPASQSTSILEGDADYLSESLFRFLKHHELI
jgi:electron transfer flavoprotein beta subunit